MKYVAIVNKQPDFNSFLLGKITEAQAKEVQNTSSDFDLLEIPYMYLAFDDSIDEPYSVINQKGDESEWAVTEDDIYNNLSDACRAFHQRLFA
jgi:hypothetical protein